jgi:MFS family permease
MPDAAHPPRRFLGWDTVFGAAWLQLLHASLFFYGFGIYVLAWDEDLGWSRTATSGGYAIVTLMTGMLGIVLGRLLERVGVRRVVVFGLVVLATGFVTLSFATSLAHFYAAMVLIGLGLSASGFLSITTVIVPWFTTRRSTALALMSLGLSLGGLVVPLLAGVVVDLGWRSALRLSAGVLALAIAPIAVLMRRPPEAYGQTPEGTRAPRFARADGAPGPAPAPAFTVAQALRTRAFWLLGIGHGAALLVVNGVGVHLVPHLVEGAAFTLPRAAAMVTVVTVVSGVGQLLGGPIGDRFDKRTLATVAMWAHAAALALLAASTLEVAVVVFAAVHGLAWGIRGPMMASMRADYFGARHFASIMGASMAVFMVGQLIGPVFAGSMADALGDYRAAFVVLALVAAASSAAFWFATPPRPPDPAPERDGAQAAHAPL